MYLNRPGGAEKRCSDGRLRLCLANARRLYDLVVPQVLVPDTANDLGGNGADLPLQRKADVWGAGEGQLNQLGPIGGDLNAKVSVGPELLDQIDQLVQGVGQGQLGDDGFPIAPPSAPPRREVGGGVARPEHGATTGPPGQLSHNGTPIPTAGMSPRLAPTGLFTREAVGWVDRAGVRSARRRDRVVNLFVMRDEVPHVELIGERYAEP